MEVKLHEIGCHVLVIAREDKTSYANHIVVEAVNHLADTVTGAILRCKCEGQSLPLCTAGSLFHRFPCYRDRLVAEVARRHPDVYFQAARYGPVFGLAAIARSHPQPVEPTQVTRLAQEWSNLDWITPEYAEVLINGRGANSND